MSDLQSATLIDRAYQPQGLRGFGWGVLGFFGSNLIMNVIGLAFLAFGEQTGDAELLALAAVTGTGLSIWAAVVFAKARKYEATRTGVYVSIFIAVLSFFVAFSEAFNG